MAQFTITVPDEVVPDLLDALARPNGWKSTQESGQKADFAKGVIRDWLKGQHREWMMNAARVQAAADAAAAAATAADPITVT